EGVNQIRRTRSFRKRPAESARRSGTGAEPDLRTGDGQLGAGNGPARWTPGEILPRSSRLWMHWCIAVGGAPGVSEGWPWQQACEESAVSAHVVSAQAPKAATIRTGIRIATAHRIW